MRDNWLNRKTYGLGDMSAYSIAEGAMTSDKTIGEQMEGIIPNCLEVYGARDGCTQPHGIQLCPCRW